MTTITKLYKLFALFGVRFELGFRYLDDLGDHAILDGLELVSLQLFLDKPVQLAHCLAQLGVKVVLHAVFRSIFDAVYLPGILWEMADHLLPSCSWSW